MSNTAIWDALAKSDPAQTKQFSRAGGFKGTALKPMWIVKRLTELFGPCGVGWGINEPSFQVVPGDNREVLVYCTISGWHGSKDQMIYGVGGDKVVSYVKANEQYNRPERWENDDEAFKKAFTDAVGNAFKFIGVGADIHMGQFDDSKYVAQMEREFAQEPQETHAKREKLTGPIKTRAEVRTALGTLARELRSITTQEGFDELTVMDYDNAALIKQVAETDAETLSFFYNGDGADFRGLKGEIEDARERIKQGTKNG